MKREVRDKRYKYLICSARLRELSAPCGEETKSQTIKIRETQKKIYMKWRFYDGYIKACEQLNKQNKETN